MNKSINKQSPNYLFRILSFLLGMCFVLYGVFLFMHSSAGDIMELLHCVIYMLMGVMFIIYAVTGRSDIQ